MSYLPLPTYVDDCALTRHLKIIFLIIGIGILNDYTFSYIHNFNIVQCPYIHYTYKRHAALQIKLSIDILLSAFRGNTSNSLLYTHISCCLRYMNITFFIYFVWDFNYFLIKHKINKNIVSFAISFLELYPRTSKF